MPWLLAVAPGALQGVRVLPWGVAAARWTPQHVQPPVWPPQLAGPPQGRGVHPVCHWGQGGAWKRGSVCGACVLWAWEGTHAGRCHGPGVCPADVDDCVASPCCQQACTNSPGGYECGCYAGYRLSADGCGCEGERARGALSWGDERGPARAPPQGPAWTPASAGPCHLPVPIPHTGPSGAGWLASAVILMLGVGGRPWRWPPGVAVASVQQVGAG